MATNPVFNRIDKEASEGAYVGFGQPGSASPQQQGQWGAPTGQPQQAPYGAPQQYGGQQQASSDQLEQMYNQPPAGPAQTGRLTVDDVVMRTLSLFGVFLVAALAAAWAVNPDGGMFADLGMPLVLAGMVGSLGLSFLIAFKKTVSVPLLLVHAVLQGAFVGGISMFMETVYPGIVMTAVLATVSTFAGMFIAYKVGLIRVTSKSRRIFGMMAMGYLVFLLINLALVMFGVTDGVFNGGPLGIAISVLGVALASYSLAVDFDSVERGIAAGAPRQYSWLMAHGILASLVWLYIEFLRLFAQLQQD